MEKRFLEALRECDKARNFKALRSTFKQFVLPVLLEVASQPLSQRLQDDVSPGACAPLACSVRDTINSLEDNDDIWFFVMESAPLMLKSSKRSRNDNEEAIVNAFVLLYGRGISNASHMRCRWKFLGDEKNSFEKSSVFINSNATERRKLQLESVLAVFSERAHRHYFSAFWSKLLGMDLPTSLHLHVLNTLAVNVMPFLTNPICLADYLSSCFSCGGLIAVLSLRGMFHLMIDHELEFPNFYDKLYSLITPDAFSSRHRYELFELVDLCMKSLRIPSYVAAALIKRTARIALLSPAPTLYFSLPFLRQLLQRHPNCLSLIHRTSASLTHDEKTTEEQQIAGLFDGIDPFNPEENDPKKCNAASSTLWELALLEKHFLPAVPLMVSAFASPAEDTTPLRFEKTYGRLFTSEITRQVTAQKVPALAYSSPNNDHSSSTNVIVV